MKPPVSGQKWDIPELATKVDFLSTLLGTVGPEEENPATPTMSVHLYRLKENQKDRQAPHREEELYYVLSGSRTLIVNGGEPGEVQTELAEGDLVYVPADATHRFVGSEEIILLVFFAPNFSG